MFEFSQLRCFVAVGEELHFGHAAHRLNMTQPPLSRQIQLLEHAIGVSLFDRTSRSVRLTAAGRSFLPEAKRLLRLAEAAALDAKRVARGDAGVLKIGFTGGSSYAFVPHLVTVAAAEMPDVELILREMRTAEQMEALVSGRLDAGLVRLPVDQRGVELVCVARDALILALPDAHALAQPDAKPTLHDLDRNPLVMYSPTENRFLYDLVSGLFRTANIAPLYVQHVNQVHTVLGLVSTGLGVAIVPDSARRLAMRGVTLRPLHPAPHATAELHIAWRQNADNPALRQFRDLVLPKVCMRTG
jgi:DNA-binding transcriptional LysR family regulator